MAESKDTGDILEYSKKGKDIGSAIAGDIGGVAGRIVGLAIDGLVALTSDSRGEKKVKIELKKSKIFL